MRLGDDAPLLPRETVSSEEYHYLVAHAGWAKQHAPLAPDAQPRQKIDLRRMPSIF
jgi:hypothetical protein